MSDDGKRRWKGPAEKKKSSGRRTGERKVIAYRAKSESSKKWIERQLSDPYVQKAKAEGFRARAAYKLLEINAQAKLLRPDIRVVDLGCAPGGWLQVAVPRINALGEKKGKKVGRIIGLDLQEVEPVPGAELRVMDFMEDGADDQVKDWLGGKADVVMSDMAAASSGHKQTDHLRIMALCEAAAYLAFDVLEDGGTFVAKVLAGGAEGDLQKELKNRFRKVSHMKPPSSRKDSSEKFVVATGFRGA